MNTLGDFLNSLAKKCGLEQDAGMISLLSNSTIATSPMPEGLANTLDTNLMSLDGAKNNPAVLNHFKPIILKAVDDKMAIIGETFGLGDDFMLEKNTYKKVELISSKFEAKIKELETKRNNTADPEKEAKFTEQIKNLQGQLATVTSSKETEISTLKNEYEGMVTNMLIEQGLSSKKYANEEIAPEVNVTIAKTILQNQMAAKGAILVNENGQLKLKQAANPTMDYVDAGFKAVSYNDFTDSVLAESKLLKVSGVQTQQTQSIPAHVQMAAQPQTNAKFDSAMSAAMEAVKI